MQHGIASTESEPIYPGYSNGANIASSLLLLRSEVLSSVVLFRIMIPFIPEKVPNLVTKNIFMGAGGARSSSSQRIDGNAFSFVQKGWR
jgi:predicted esterase